MKKLSKVTAKHQVTIPVKVRQELSIVPGTKVDIQRQGEEYVLILNPIEAIRKKWHGKFKGESTIMEYMDEVRGIVN
ncbi:MAG: AbrB/MazE/SpoVT family DNA-binding domain-containing protein [Deltaproteobacteria bacterium]|nr:AbrB/MazE/SpoVT family DNA-binding domain-containing protein [Deltaproteobacteria bacterium]